MARYPQQGRTPSIAPQSIIPGGVNQSGAPIGVGNNLNRLAGALGQFGVSLDRKIKQQEAQNPNSKANIREQEKINAQREFLAAKRSNTLDELRKATISGKLPEGASPAYNDYRKTLLAMDAVQNIYGKGLRAHLDTLVNPDTAPEDKAALMQKLWSETGIDKMGLDSFGMEKVTKAATKIQSAIDEAGNKRYIELNKQKMDDSLDTVALNSVSSFQHPDEINSSFLNAIKLARDASVLDPVKRVSAKYFQAISNMAEKDPDRAQDALDALETAKYKDGTKPLGSLELQTQAAKLSDQIERAKLQEDARANKKLASMSRDSARAIEAGLEGKAAEDPRAIKDAYDKFIDDNPDLPTEVKLSLKDQRTNRIRKAEAEQTMDVDMKRQYVRDVALSTDVYTTMASQARDSTELQQQINDVNSQAGLDERDKAAIIANMTMIHRERGAANAAFDANIGDKEMASLGLDQAGVQKMISDFKMPAEAVETDAQMITEQMKSTYNSEFTKELTRLANQTGLTLEQAKLMNLPAGEKDPVTKETIYDKQKTLVGQAAATARLKAGLAAKKAIMARQKEYATQNAVRTQSLNTLAKSMTKDLAASLKSYANSSTIDQTTSNRARQAIVTTRVNLSQLAAAARMDGEDLAKAEGYTNAPALDNYYKLQNALGYSLKEIVQGKSFAGIQLDGSRIDPARTRIVWNKKELEVLKKIPENKLNELAQNLNISDGKKLIELQTKLL